MKRHPEAEQNLEASKAEIRRLLQAETPDMDLIKKAIDQSSAFLDQVLCNHANEDDPDFGCRHS